MVCSFYCTLDRVCNHFPNRTRKRCIKTYTYTPIVRRPESLGKSRRHSTARRVNEPASCASPQKPRASSSRLLDVCAGNRFGDMYHPQHAPAICHESLRRLTAALSPSSTPPRGLRWSPRFQGANSVHAYLGSGTPSTSPRRAALSLPGAPAFQVVRERWHVSGGSAANGISS
ncbi:hypothetical protein CPLU01_02531 [Colletotrichum plurivorum]|uniref:Uncharacterized protein n=1 Tax=Colletotrichum plurivorum TaxID=2175906 RepID=A0A8H6KVG1_9PEZI|nr:hypothetical protein CPLU01_02531 [Colletotrichum plurivorum]